MKNFTKMLTNEIIKVGFTLTDYSGQVLVKLNEVLKHLQVSTGIIKIEEKNSSFESAEDPSLGSIDSLVKENEEELKNIDKKNNEIHKTTIKNIVVTAEDLSDEELLALEVAFQKSRKEQEECDAAEEENIQEYDDDFDPLESNEYLAHKAEYLKEVKTSIKNERSYKEFCEKFNLLNNPTALIKKENLDQLVDSKHEQEYDDDFDFTKYQDFLVKNRNNFQKIMKKFDEIKELQDQISTKLSSDDSEFTCTEDVLTVKPKISEERLHDIENKTGLTFSEYDTKKFVRSNKVLNVEPLYMEISTKNFNKELERLEQNTFYKDTLKELESILDKNLNTKYGNTKMTKPTHEEIEDRFKELRLASKSADWSSVKTKTTADTELKFKIPIISKEEKKIRRNKAIEYIKEYSSKNNYSEEEKKNLLECFTK